ncbi:MAG: YwiC-like family protein [Thermoanaerobaculia bacterium]
MATVPFARRDVAAPAAGWWRALMGDPAGQVRIRNVAIPGEHGGWGFILEPIVLGLLVAPSWSGLLLALAAFSGFLARQPMKYAMVDRSRDREVARTPVAVRFFVLYAALAVAFFAAAVSIGGTRMLLPIALAAPLGLIQVWYDAKNRSRTLLPELTGPIAIASVTPAIAIADGWALVPAFALWVLLAARGLPSILYVRARLRLERGTEFSKAGVIFAHTVAPVAGVALLVAGSGSMLAVAALVLLFARAAHGLSPWRGKASAKGIGFREIGYGAIAVFAFAAGALLGV